MTPLSLSICKKMLSAPFQPSWEGVQKQTGASIQEAKHAKHAKPPGIHVKKEIIVGCPLYLQEFSAEEQLPACHVPAWLSSIL